MPPAISRKHKLPLGGLQRRVRARREDIEPEIEEFSEEEGGSANGDSSNVSDREGEISDESDSVPGSEDDDDEEDEEDEEEGGNVSSTVAQISFGALAKAQASMPDIRRKKARRTDSEDEDDEAEETGPSKQPSGDYSKHSSKPPKPPQRSSKHAPTEMSSKRQVSRKREVVSMNKVAARDPRFSSASGTVDEVRARKAYAFLDEYRDAEMAELKTAMKKTRSESEKESLARTLKSMQSRKEAQSQRDAEHEVVAQHRRQEKELVAQGKKPFYLKKSEQKKQLLLERFAGMKKKQVDRSIERRRKKLTSRERRNMPVARRDAA
ncbi:hypothetical protein F4678DRAFT_412508 [Xylaria arbuscula]|nr:hypothetical protein F4678DRAFT_412508 [Xylaria arbuscula]